MTIVHTIARPLMAGMFVYGGLDSFRNPATKVRVARPVVEPIAEALPVDVPDDVEQLVKINGAVQVAAAVLMALGRFPRLCALVLAATLVPTTVAGHRFWELDDPDARRQQTIHFLKNASMFGGLLIAAADTGRRPSVTWRAEHASRRAVRRAARVTGRAQRSASRTATRAAGTVAAALPG